MTTPFLNAIQRALNTLFDEQAGEDAVFHYGSSSASVRVIFGAESRTAFAEDEFVLEAGNNVLFVRKSEMPSAPREGDYFLVRGEKWTVVDSAAKNPLYSATTSSDTLAWTTTKDGLAYKIFVKKLEDTQ